MDINRESAFSEDTSAGANQFDVAFNLVLAIFAGQPVYFVISLRSDRLFEELGDIYLHCDRYDFEFSPL